MAIQFAPRLFRSLFFSVVESSQQGGIGFFFCSINELLFLFGISRVDLDEMYLK